MYNVQYGSPAAMAYPLAHYIHSKYLQTAERKRPARVTFICLWSLRGCVHPWAVFGFLEEGNDEIFFDSGDVREKAGPLFKTC